MKNNIFLCNLKIWSTEFLQTEHISVPNNQIKAYLPEMCGDSTNWWCWSLELLEMMRWCSPNSRLVLCTGFNSFIMSWHTGRSHPLWFCHLHTLLKSPVSCSINILKSCLALRVIKSRQKLKVIKSALL